MRLTELVETSRRVAETRARNQKIELLAACLRAAGVAAVETAVLWLSGELRQGRIGVGPAALASLRPAEAASTSALLVTEVDQVLARVARARGAGSGKERMRLLAELLARATRDEQGFLLRLLGGELRQGALEGVVAEALARAFDAEGGRVRRALMLAGDFAAVARALAAQGSAGLAGFGLRVFQPLQPMLASPSDDVEAALARLCPAGEEAAFEHKLDGARIQVHKRGADVRVFTRSQKDVTAAVPEIVEATLALSARELVLDGEAIALRADLRPHPFQVTMRRFGRKLDVEAARAELALSPFFFDCLLLDGEELVDRSGAERSELMSALLPPELVVPRLVTGELERAQAFVRAALERGHEGVMAKSLAAPYAAGARGQEWLKLKPVHTLDLVVLAAEWGSGRRHGWLSNLHLGARDEASGGFAMLGKTFKGMTDEVLAWQTGALLERQVEREGATVHVRPELVVEVAFNDVQQSPHYASGLALRFARLVRYRADKRAEEADTLALVRAIHAGQGGRGADGGRGGA